MSRPPKRALPMNAAMNAAKPNVAPARNRPRMRNAGSPSTKATSAVSDRRGGDGQEPRDVVGDHLPGHEGADGHEPVLPEADLA